MLLFFCHSVLDLNCRCLFSEKAQREGKNLFKYCLPELFFPLFFPCFSHLWCRDDDKALRVTVFIEMEIERIVLTLFALFLILILTKCDYSRPVTPPHMSHPLADCTSSPPFPDDIHPLVGETHTSGILLKTCSGAHPVSVLK